MSRRAPRPGKAPPTDERAEDAYARAAVYRVLSQGFAYPTSQGLSALVEQDLPAAADASERLGDDVAAPLAAVGHRFAHVEHTALAREYESVFSHVASVDWPPYETAYTTTGEVFMQTNDLADIAGFYAAYGVGLAKGFQDRPDHLVAELEFMYLLAYKEAFALERHGIERADGCREDQRRFLEAHLGRWAVAFAGRLTRGAGDSPYTGLADACAALVTLDIRSLGARPDPVGEPVLPVPDAAGCEECPVGAGVAAPGGGDA